MTTKTRSVIHLKYGVAEDGSMQQSLEQSQARLLGCKNWVPDQVKAGLDWETRQHPYFYLQGEVVTREAALNWLLQNGAPEITIKAFESYPIALDFMGEPMGFYE